MFTIGLIVMFMAAAAVVIYSLTVLAVFISVVVQVIKNVGRELNK